MWWLLCVCVFACVSLCAIHYFVLNKWCAFSRSPSYALHLASEKVTTTTMKTKTSSSSSSWFFSSFFTVTFCLWFSIHWNYCCCCCGCCHVNFSRKLRSNFPAFILRRIRCINSPYYHHQAISVHTYACIHMYKAHVRQYCRNKGERKWAKWE